MAWPFYDLTPSQFERFLTTGRWDLVRRAASMVINAGYEDPNDKKIQSLLADLHHFNNYLANPGQIFDFTVLSGKIMDLGKLLARKDEGYNQLIRELYSQYRILEDALAHYPKQRPASSEESREYQQKIENPYRNFRDTLKNIISRYQAG